MVNTKNDFLFGSDGRTLAPMMPPFITTREQAYRTAAWIKTMAIMLPTEDEENTFEEIEEAIRNS